MAVDTGEFMERIPAARLAEAGRVLAGPGADRASGERFLQAARAHGVPLDECWGASGEPGGAYRAVTLLVPSSGSTLMVYTSPVVSESGAARLGRLLDRACGAARGGAIAQALLEPEETAARGAYEQAGFLFVGELLYLRRPWSEPGEAPASWPEGVEVEAWREGMEADLAVALERSYEGTLDCPELCGLRRTEDVIASHRATGSFDPHLWWLVRDKGAPAGVVLLNPNPAQDHTELVYLGLAPSLRGRGLASGLLRMGLAALRGRKHRTALCAVDSRNAPAQALYRRAGFRPFARRVALVRPIRPA